MADRREMLEAALEEVLEPDEGKPLETEEEHEESEVEVSEEQPSRNEKGQFVAKDETPAEEASLEVATEDAPEAEEAWRLKQEMTAKEAPMVMSDIEGYVSQVDGTWIKSRSHHREHLKQHRMIELGNDVPLQHKPVELSRKEQETRKRKIAELAYAKLSYR